MSEVQVEFYVSMLGKTWEFRGFDAIRELAEWMDRNASNVMGSPSADGGPALSAATDEERFGEGSRERA